MNATRARQLANVIRSSFSELAITEAIDELVAAAIQESPSGVGGEAAGTARHFIAHKEWRGPMGPVAKIEAAIETHGALNVSLAEDGSLRVPDRGVTAIALRYFYLGPADALAEFLGRDTEVEELRERARQEWEHSFASAKSAEADGDSTIGPTAYRERTGPVVHAMQFTGKNSDEITMFLGGFNADETHRWGNDTTKNLTIFNAQGLPEIARLGDWIIKDVNGSYFLVGPTVFSRMYVSGIDIQNPATDGSVFAHDAEDTAFIDWIDAYAGWTSTIGTNQKTMWLEFLVPTPGASLRECLRAQMKLPPSKTPPRSSPSVPPATRETPTNATR